MTPPLKAFTIIAGSYTSFLSTYKFVPNGHSSTITLVGQSEGVNASWIVRHPQNRSLLYSTNEYPSGGVSSYIIQPNGLVSLVDKVPSLGADPAFLAVVRGGKEVLVPNYTSGSVQSHILGKDQAYFTSSSNLLQFNGSGPDISRQASAHPHEAVEFGNEVLMPDLGSDKIWRLVKVGNDWTIKGYIPQPTGSGPRHIVPYGGKLYTLHELANTLTEQKFPTLNPPKAPELLANISIVPTDVPKGSLYGAAELELAPFSLLHPTRYLYASNRNVSPDPNLVDPRGDSIAVFAIEPKLKLVKQVFTGLQQIRGMGIGGDQGQYIAAAGLTGGGVAIFERIGDDLKLLARYTGPGSEEIVSFVWL